MGPLGSAFRGRDLLSLSGSLITANSHFSCPTRAAASLMGRSLQGRRQHHRAAQGQRQALLRQVQPGAGCQVAEAPAGLLVGDGAGGGHQVRQGKFLGPPEEQPPKRRRSAVRTAEVKSMSESSFTSI